MMPSIGTPSESTFAGYFQELEGFIRALETFLCKNPRLVAVRPEFIKTIHFRKRLPHFFIRYSGALLWSSREFCLGLVELNLWQRYSGLVKVAMKCGVTFRRCVYTRNSP